MGFETNAKLFSKLAVEFVHPSIYILQDPQTVRIKPEEAEEACRSPYERF